MIEEQNTEADQRSKIVAETAKMPWSELQRWFAGGAAIYVAEELDLIDVAWKMSQDNKAALEPWVTSGQVTQVTDQQAVAWLDEDATLWATVVKPWVLVQPIS